MKYVAVPKEKMGINSTYCLDIMEDLPPLPVPALTDKGNHGIKEDELEIIFLGTGCSASSKYRNETAVYLNFFNSGGMVLDVGGGTYGQLFRKYGPNKIDEVLRGIKVIWVSHTHADHIEGTIRLLHMRHLAFADSNEDERVMVIGPRTIADNLYEYCACCICSDDRCKKVFGHPEFLFTFVDNFDFRAGKHPALSEFFMKEFGISKAFSLPVYHTFMAHALVLEHSRGWSVVFSGDTSVCPPLISSCTNPTVLIHEASFEDTLEGLAAGKGHSTIGQAIITGERMGAKSTILTHFSQRYPKTLNMATQHSHNVAAACDFMTVNLAHHHLLSTIALDIGDKMSATDDDEVVDLDMVE
jgi:ribonuclease Z